MSGINTTTGLISGLDYAGLIQQLLAIESRPKTLAQRRVIELQSDQASYLDINSKLSALKSAASAFRTANIFRSSSVSSSADAVLTGSASPGAALGGFSFLVDRVVGTQQVLSRGFVDRSASAIGATSITLESAQARLDSNTPLSALNGGQGISRGKIVVTDHGGRTATIDLSRVATVGELLEKLNTSDQVRISASVAGDKIVIEDRSGVAGTLRIENAVGYTTATSLGIEGTSTNAPLEGEPVYYIGDATALQSLNDGNGIRISSAAGTSSPDFTINTRDGSTYAIDIGNMYGADGKLTASAVADIAGLKTRINEQTEGKVSLEITPDGRALRLVDSTSGGSNFEVIDIRGAAKDLRIVGSTASDAIEGRAVLAGLNSTLASNLGGGSGLASGDFSITTRDGATHTFSVSTDGSVADILAQIEDLTGGAVVARIRPDGVGITLTDTTSGTNPFVVQGEGAEALGLATAPEGVASSTIGGTRLQRRYISESTLVSSLNDGAGIGTGEIEIRGPRGTTTKVDIGSDAKNLGDIISEINSKGIGVTARINDRGDGILLEKSAGETGTNKISVRDVTGAVGRNLNILGEAENGTDKNYVDGSLEKTIELTAADTLDTLVTKINNAGAGVRASVIRDAAGSSPYRLKLTAAQTGLAGAFVVSSEGVDLGLTTISDARNARVFFGSDDPARAVLIESSTNTIDGVIDGVTVTAKSVSDTPVTLTVSRDTGAIKSAVRSFVDAFNSIANRISQLTDYDQDSNRKGPLLGDSTANELRRGLFDQLQRAATGVSGPYRFLSQVGIKVGQGGQLSLDEAKLDEALATDPEAVEALFAARTQVPRDTRVPVGDTDGIFVNNTGPDEFSSLGLGEQFARFVDKYINSVDGILKRRTEAIDTEIRNQNSRIEAFDVRLERRRDILTRQFAALEQTLANLQRQQGALSQLPVGTR